jgi:hypothetical protein
MRTVGACVSAFHLAAGLAVWLAFGEPGSMLLFGGCAVITLGLALATAPLLEPPPPRDGGTPRPPGDEPPEPPWWPEFERALREHCERERSSA